MSTVKKKPVKDEKHKFDPLGKHEHSDFNLYVAYTLY